MRGPTVAQLMTRGPVTVRPDTPVKAIVVLLVEREIGAVAVLDDSGSPVGVVAEGDLIPRREKRRRHRRPSEPAVVRTAADLMTTPVDTITADVSYAAAARELCRTGRRRLFVTDDENRLIGVLSRGDLLRLYDRTDEDVRANVLHEVFERTLWADLRDVHVAVVDGLVTLEGHLDRESEVEIAGRLTAAVPGVVAVRNKLRYLSGRASAS
ncbi:CBS domain-containing protein [Fodinicola acaciae]|uniref:CBS domain-containing protein n=1 Tax=Fodinicola acaciae TaxID=2681555 RepID=UPI0013D33D66|nr:CBS domain-containing protein [Fodinicola acaciae]